MRDQSFAILSLEQERCKALVARDFEKLGRLLASNLLHVHAKGRIEDRGAYLANVQNNLEFIRIDRGNLNVRVYGDVAVVVGPLQQTVKLKTTGQVHEMSGIATQVWVRDSSDWEQASFHICEKHGPQ